MNRQHSDPERPWNPREPVEISPEEFERQVLDWVRASLMSSNVRVAHQARVLGQGGEYAIDIHVQLSLLDQAVVVFLIECKHQRRPVERDALLILEGKLRDAGAHKGIIFSTSGFQKGAITYADAHGIATVTVIAGAWLYETKALGPTPTPPPWLNLPKYAGVRLSPTENGVASHAILPDHLEALSEFLGNEASPQG